jgi:hypothetical protein
MLVSRTTISLLGAPRIEAGGAPIEVDTRKAIALLAYLAVTLRRTLSSLGRARAEGWLDADREGIDLNPEETWVDVHRFHDLLAECRTHGHPEADVCPRCLPLLSEVVALYRDDFLAGFALRDSAPFDDWQFFQAARSCAASWPARWRGSATATAPTASGSLPSRMRGAGWPWIPCTSRRTAG